MSNAELLRQIRVRLEGYPAGVHRLACPCFVLDAELPAAVADVLRCFDGVDLFQETLVLAASRDVTRVDGRYLVGVVSGDDLLVDRDGRVWTLEKDTDELLAEGSNFVRWLSGWVEAEAVYYDKDGEFIEGAFDDAGEPTPQLVVRREERLLKRDTAASAPRWRLARALARLGHVERARAELETLVEHTPTFSWAWYELGRLSEQLAELRAAIDDYQAAAEAEPAYEHNAFFLAHAARVANKVGDEERRAALAEAATEADPSFARSQRDAAGVCLEEGDVELSRELAELAAALIPRDLVLRDLIARIGASSGS